MDLKEIIDRNYKATVKRGLITPTTDFNDFYKKIIEELHELGHSTIIDSDSKKILWVDHEEIADIIIVCLAMAKHYNIDIQKVLEEKTIFNENR